MGSSQIDGWFTGIGDFMTSVGTITATPKAADYIDPSFMQRVKADPALAAFATRKD
jgi:NitT/TauT family transport system substrate-binding protein